MRVICSVDKYCYNWLQNVCANLLLGRGPLVSIMLLNKLSKITDFPQFSSNSLGALGAAAPDSARPNISISMQNSQTSILNYDYTVLPIAPFSKHQ